MSTVTYFFIGDLVAYGTSFFVDVQHLALRNGYELLRFFLLDDLRRRGAGHRLGR